MPFNDQPIEEPTSERLRGLAAQRQILFERLHRCLWYLEAVGEAEDLEAAKKFADQGLRVGSLSEGVQRQISDGTWADASPIPGPTAFEIRRRVRECWLILTNKARSVRWY